MSVSTIIILVASVVGPLVAYLVAARQFSGKVDNSDARELWAESRAIRDWSQARITTLNDHVTRLEARIETVEANNVTLIKENQRLSREVRDLNEEVHDLNETIIKLRDNIIDLTNRLKRSQERVIELEGTNNA